MPPVLCIYNSLYETELHTDASIHGFGMILLQKQTSGHMDSTVYFSHATNKAEKNYHSYDA